MICYNGLDAERVAECMSENVTYGCALGDIEELKVENSSVTCADVHVKIIIACRRIKNRMTRKNARPRPVINATACKLLTPSTKPS